MRQFGLGHRTVGMPRPSRAGSNGNPQYRQRPSTGLRNDSPLVTIHLPSIGSRLVRRMRSDEHSRRRRVFRSMRIGSWTRDPPSWNIPRIPSVRLLPRVRVEGGDGYPGRRPACIRRSAGLSGRGPKRVSGPPSNAGVECVRVRSYAHRLMALRCRAAVQAGRSRILCRFLRNVHSRLFQDPSSNTQYGRPVFGSRSMRKNTRCPTLGNERAQRSPTRGCRGRIRRRCGCRKRNGRAAGVRSVRQTVS